MEYEISIEIKADYLHATVKGVRTYSSVSALTRDVFNAAIKANISQVLIDVRELDGRLGLFDSLYIVRNEFPKYRWKGIGKAVIVDRATPGMRRWFFETAAYNRGYNLRMFQDIKDALEWLHS